jgi:hypothetical protein
VSGADIVGFDPAVDRIDLGNANIHSFIIIDTAQGFGFMSPWSGETVIVQGIRLADLSVENFEYIDNNHLREAVSGALAWENGPVLAADTVYMRSHEVGQVDRVAFDPATDVVSFKFYGSRENLTMTDSPEGVVVADLSTGQKLILLGVTRADLSPVNFQFTFTQVREDDVSGKIGMGQASDAQIVDFNLPIAGGGTVAGASGAADGVAGGAGEALPALSIADLSVAEGDGGHAHFMFVVTLDKAADGPVTVAYSTADGTAAAGDDYAAASGTVTFTAGETSKMVHVDIAGDVLAEGNETFTVNLSNASGATLADATAVGTIVNDDSEPDQGHVGNGKADTFAITWAWGTNKKIEFDSALDTLDFSWMAKDHFSIAEANGSTVITIEGNNQTYTLTDVSLAALSLANIAAKDASALAEWTTALDAAQAVRDYDLMM